MSVMKAEKLLVVESDDALKQNIVAVLSDAGYEVSTDYGEGMKGILAFDPDAIVLGANPPQLDCCDLLSQIKGSEHTQYMRVVLWEVSPFLDTTGNTPPFIGFHEKGPFVQGPRGQSQTLSAAVGVPLELPVWVADDASVIPGAARPPAPPIVVTWEKFRGPGAMTLSEERPPVKDADFPLPPKTQAHGKATTKITFSEPGEYVLLVTANDWSGEGGHGIQCCWSNSQVRVSVK